MNNENRINTNVPNNGLFYGPLTKEQHDRGLYIKPAENVGIETIDLEGFIGTSISFEEKMRFLNFNLQEYSDVLKNLRYKNYGINENVIQNLNPVQFNKLKNKLILEYGFSENDAKIILGSIKETPSHAYEAVCNIIFHQFSNSPELFEATFGYPMYIKEDNSIVKFNGEEMLLDLYMFANDKKNGGNLFDNGKISVEKILPESTLTDCPLLNVDNDQRNFYLNDDVIDKFLKSKDESLYFKSSISNIYDKTSALTCFMLSDKSFTLKYTGNKEIKFKNGNKEKVVDNNVLFTITRTNNNGFEVLTGSEKYYISFDDLFFDENYIIFESDVRVNPLYNK